MLFRDRDLPTAPRARAPGPRRRIPPRIAALACLALGWSACGEPREPAEPDARSHRAPSASSGAALGAYSVQLHVHGSFSEGLGSIDSQSAEAVDLGLDALWWSDHDWRLSSYHTLSRFSFEAPGEAPREAPGSSAGVAVEHDRLGDWTLTGARFEPRFAPRFERVDKRSTAAGDVQLTDERASDGAWSYRVTATDPGPELREVVARLEAPMPGFGRPLAADLSVSFSLWVDGVGEDGRAWLELRLSEHPRSVELEGTGGALSFAPHFLRYVLGDPAAAPYPDPVDANVLWVPLAPLASGAKDEASAGGWRRYTVRPGADAAAGFAGSTADDNALTALNLGLAARASATVTAFIDGIEIDAAHRGEVMFERQAEVIERVAAGYPGLTQLQGVEISYLHPHLNEFSVDTELLDYDALAESSGLLNAAREVSEDALRETFARRAVELAHGRGGLISFNHFLGTDPEGRRQERPREVVLAELLDHRLYGADLLEVGYRDRGGHPLRNHLWTWDRLALDGALRPVGVGVSDHHGGPERARTMANNFVTWIWAAEPSKRELIEGLRAGRAFFGDPGEFDGTLELRTARGHRMGQIVLSDRNSAELEIAIDGLEATDRVIVVESGELARFLDVEGPAFRSVQSLALPPQGGFVRVESFARDGTALVFSNPIHYVREVPEGGLDPARGAIDVGGVRSVTLGDLRLREVRPVSGAGWRGVRLAGSAEGGTLVLETEVPGSAGAGNPPPGGTELEVELKGMEGSVERGPGGRVTVRGLRGSGRVVLKRPE